MSHKAVIDEPGLIDNLVNKTVKRLCLIQGECSKFYLYVTLTWKEGEHLLETQRKKPRAWASLDRLIRHINSKYGPIPVIELKLKGNYGTPSNTSKNSEKPGKKSINFAKQ
jgi:hypothetical protein